MDPYPLPARPLPDDIEVAPLIDVREPSLDMSVHTGLSPWLWCIEYVRGTLAGPDDVARRRLVEEPIKSFSSDSGSDQHQLALVLEALDEGRPVAFYGWWPTADVAGTTDILGVDAMEVPPPDRKGSGLADGHAVVLVGYGRHDAFPGGGYFLVCNPWCDAGWGVDGLGYLPFTYVRAYAIALRTFRFDREGARQPSPVALGDTAGSVVNGHPVESTAANGKGSGAHGNPIDSVIARSARCYDPRSTYTHLFFSENPLDVTRAKAICSRCTVREQCLSRALERREPYGVWGGEFVLDGAVVAVKRGRGRPRKVPLPTVVDEVTGMPVVA